MTIQVYPYSVQEEKDLLDFLKSRHYSYKSTDDDVIDEVFLTGYNKEIVDAEAEIDAGNYVSNDDVKKFFADKKKRVGGN